MTEIEQIIQETWQSYYQCSDTYTMHESEIECCNDIAKAIEQYVFDEKVKILRKFGKRFKISFEDEIAQLKKGGE